jgi:hypothetical protein
MNFRAIGLFLLFLTFPFISTSQVRPAIKFGAVTMEELKMTVYDKDSSASAVKLFDVGESLVTGVRSTFSRHTRIKILNEEGLQYGSVIVPFFSLGSYYGNLGTFSGLRASTYNLENGKMVETKLETKGKFKEELVDGISVIRFALPQVKVGSIIEYKYNIEVLILLELRSWDFQDLIPCRWSEYEAHVSHVTNFQYSFRGYLSPIINEKKSEYCGGVSATEASKLRIPSEYLEEFRECEYYHWAIGDVPAFKEEPFISSRKNYQSGVSFNLTSIDPPGPTPPSTFMSTWDELTVKYIDETFSDNSNVKKTGFLQERSQELVKGLTSPDEKVRAIYQYVKTNLAWTGSYSNRITEPKEIFEQKKGASGDLNLVLLAMLRYAGLQADPVLISTRSNGFIRQDAPVRSQFNSVLVLSDYKGKKMVLDATDKFLSMEFLPSSCLNGLGYKASPGSYQWINLMESPKTRKTVSMDLALGENGTLSGGLTALSTGYEARSIRDKISTDGIKKHLEDFLKGKTIHLLDTTIENLDKVSEPLKETYSIEMADHAQSSGEVIYLDPVIFEKQASNPFLQPERKYPIDYAYPQETIFIFKLKIPAGYVVDELPQTKISVLPENAGKFVYSSSVLDGTISIMSQFVLNKALFSQQEYPGLRELYNIVVTKHSEQIVLKKKTQ